MKRTLSLVLACVCLFAFLVTECNADCSGSQLGDRVKSGLSRIVGIPKKIKQSVQSKKAASCASAATSCSGAAPAASCSGSPVMGCSAPAVVPVAVVLPVSAPVFEAAPECPSGTCTVQESVRSFQPIRSGIAQTKANLQAAQGRMRHVGGSFGAGRFEGVGFSTVSADAAIQACCYWGQRTPVDIGVARGASGWYATVLYR